MTTAIIAAAAYAALLYFGVGTLVILFIERRHPSAQFEVHQTVSAIILWPVALLIVLFWTLTDWMRADA